MILAHGGHTGGWSLYVKDRQPKFAYNWFGRELYEVIAPELPAGAVTLRWEFIYDGGKMPGAGGRGDFFIDGEQVASGRIERTIPFFIGTEPADVGMDDLTPVTRNYPPSTTSSPAPSTRSSSVSGQWGKPSTRPLSGTAGDKNSQATPDHDFKLRAKMEFVTLRPLVLEREDARPGDVSSVA